MRGESILRILIKGRIEGQKIRGRRTTMGRMLKRGWQQVEVDRELENVVNGNIGHTEQIRKTEIRKGENQ